MVAGCGGSSAADPAKKLHPMPKWKFPYDLNRPVRHAVLPGKLEEISGLAWAAPDLLACVQDEKGNIYLYDLNRKETTGKIDFAKPGDFEGVAKVGEVYWVVRSDGRLYRVKSEKKVKKYDSFLDEDYDVEGLCYDKAKNRLLIACKGYPGKKLGAQKAIYAFDLETKTVDKTPLYTISLAALEEELGERSGLKKGVDKLGEFFNPGKGNTTFQPSAIAIHPKTKYVYILAHVGKIIVVLNRKGELIHIEKVPEKLLSQPEGLCFSPDGKMFIASEAAGGKAKIVEYHKK